MAPFIVKLSSVWTSKDVPCSSQLHSAHSVIWEIKGIWIVQCFYGLVGPVLHEQGAWTPLIYWAPQQKEAIAAWGKVDSCRRAHLQQTASPHSCHTLQYFPISADATTIVKCACTVILLTYHKPLGGLCPNDPLYSHSVSGLICVGESHTLLLSPPNLHLSFFLSLPLSAFLSTLSLGL